MEEGIISKIELQLGDTTISLTMEQARKLMPGIFTAEH